VIPKRNIADSDGQMEIILGKPRQPASVKGRLKWWWKGANRLVVPDVSWRCLALIGPIKYGLFAESSTGGTDEIAHSRIPAAQFTVSYNPPAEPYEGLQRAPV